MSSEKTQFFREIFSPKHDYGDLVQYIRNVLSHFPKLLDNFSASYEQKSKKKTSQNFTTENFPCFDVHDQLNFDCQNLAGHGHQNIGNF